MTWRDSLVRIADHQVEALRKRLVAIAERRVMLEMRIAMLHAELASETAHMDADAEAGFYRLGFLQGWRVRRDALNAELEAIEQEEAGARDALTGAFEELKRYEEVAGSALKARVAVQAGKDRAEMDELGLRRAGR